MSARTSPTPSSPKAPRKAIGEGPSADKERERKKARVDRGESFYAFIIARQFKKLLDGEGAQAAREDLEKRFDKNFGIKTVAQKYRDEGIEYWENYSEWVRESGDDDEYERLQGYTDEMVLLLRDQNELIRVLCEQLKKKEDSIAGVIEVLGCLPVPATFEN
jgi:hypothetical protein